MKTPIALSSLSSTTSATMASSSASSSSLSLPPRLYLGTMTFGWSQSSSKVDEKVAYQMLDSFIQHQKSTTASHNHHPIYHIDTARIYSGGKSETIVGTIMKQWYDMNHDDKNDNNIDNNDDTNNTTNHNNTPFAIGTKAHPSQLHGLSKLGIQNQINESLESMKPSSIKYFDEYYLHQPDINNSLYDSLVCLNEYCNDGIIGNIGMSNYHADEVKHAYQLCNDNNLIHKPTIYQGLYNPLNRLVEDELIPYLHANDCSFIAYNPLAGGLLVDNKHVVNNTKTTNDDDNNNTTTIIPDIPLKGRFYKNHNYIPRFYTKTNFDAVSLIQNVCNIYNITMIEATYRWLMYHSALKGTDGILIGASSIQQLKQNINICTKSYNDEPLNDHILKVFDQAWDITRSTAFPYWRSYSLDMPNRNELDHGASYDPAATGKK